MDDSDRAELQVISVESQKPGEVVCIVRCVGGVARNGQRFSIEHAKNFESEAGQQNIWTLTEINRYGKTVEFFDPPHGAKVSLAGPDAEELEGRVVLKQMLDGAKK
ncbi:hypothetical protein ACIBUY_19855 [Streptomyces sp. NPDC050085]|uniref:hypothetical protein n=1 Tax=Streptomyces sp. NPDC050085 TaxID=3365600 RepID=UPI0037A61B89